MELHLSRYKNGAKACLGNLSTDGKPECVTLEDPVRDLGPDGKGKIYGQTAIPAGRYRLALFWSPKFKKKMVAVTGVPFFTGILIHSGNTDEDTLGCVLVGQVVDNDDHIHGGSTEMPLLFEKIRKVIEDDKKEAWLTVTNDFPEALR